MWGYLGFWTTGRLEFISYGIFGSAAILNFSRGYIFFTLNEFQLFQDIKKLNKWIDKHNKKIDEMDAHKV